MEQTKKHLYLYLVVAPFEAIIASMLKPRDFVFHMITPSEKSTHQALVLELDWSIFFDQEGFEELESTVLKNLVQHSDGRPKRTVYVSEYRALEFSPFEAMKSLYLGQKNGLIIQIEKGPVPEMYRKRFLFQIVAPTKVMVASTLNPLEFIEGYSKEAVNIIRFPKIFLIDMKIAGLIHNSDGDIKELMYPDKDGLAKAFGSLVSGEKVTKMTNRSANQIYWPMINTGFYIGSGDEVIFYPYPDEKADPHYEHWFSFSWHDQK